MVNYSVLTLSLPLSSSLYLLPHLQGSFPLPSPLPLSFSPFLPFLLSLPLAAFSLSILPLFFSLYPAPYLNHPLPSFPCPYHCLHVFSTHAYFPPAMKSLLLTFPGWLLGQHILHVHVSLSTSLLSLPRGVLRSRGTTLLQCAGGERFGQSVSL